MRAWIHRMLSCSKGALGVNNTYRMDSSTRARGAGMVSTRTAERVKPSTFKGAKDPRFLCPLGSVAFAETSSCQANVASGFAQRLTSSGPATGGTTRNQRSGVTSAGRSFPMLVETGNGATTVVPIAIGIASGRRLDGGQFSRKCTESVSRSTNPCSIPKVAFVPSAARTRCGASGSTWQSTTATSADTFAGFSVATAIAVLASSGMNPNGLQPQFAI